MHYSENVTLLGAGKVKTKDLNDSLRLAPILIAADGGAKIAVKLGQIPQKVIGDFDSIDEKTLGEIPPARRLIIEEQSTTDFEKCLSRVSAPLILGIGFLGKRLDHQLSALNALAKFESQKCILIGNQDIVFHLPSSFEMRSPVGTRVSLFPMNPAKGRSVGLHWPIDGIEFSPNQMIGTSNVTVDSMFKIQMNTPGMLAILPRATLPRVIDALT